MFRYALVLLLINPYYYSLGLPNPPIFSNLYYLSNNCENVFIKNKIQESINNCSYPFEKESAAELRCLMFYDINKKLCEPRHLKSDIAENFKKNLLKEADTGTLCTYAPAWVFGHIDAYSNYTQLSDEIFKNSIKCHGVCAEQNNIKRNDSNFFCKYFKWGSDLLHTLSSDSNNELDLQPLPNANNLSTNVTVENTINHSENITSTTIDGAKKTIEKVSAEKSANKVPEQVETIQKLGVNDSKTIVFQTLSVPSSSTNKIEKSPVLEETEKKDNEVSPKKGEEKTIPEVDTKEAVLESPDDHGDPQDNFASDMDAEDDGEQDGLPDDDQLNADPKLNLDKIKSNEKKIESIVPLNEDIAQKDNFSNTIQDTFDEDDDHFFPFFMTAIIVVILLYVLYHNKNKFSKVMLGLLVEGRQGRGGRGTRGGRTGPAYRRLDSLEQALGSGAAPAAPSKVIY